MILIKIGGGSTINYRGILEDLVGIEERVIIVHGANYQRDKLLSELNKEKRVVTSISGYSSVYTDSTIIDSMLMSYSGLANKNIVRQCQELGINAVGLSGIDGAIVTGQRNKGIKVKENGKKKVLRDLSGKPQELNTHLLDLLLDNGYVPVLTMPILDEKYNIINSENDDLVSLLCQNYDIQTVYQFIEEIGLLADRGDPNSLIRDMNMLQLRNMEERVENRMKRKLHAISSIFENSKYMGIKVVIADGRISNAITQALVLGTSIKRD